MADLDYTVNIVTNNAVKNLTNIGNQVDKLSGRFNGLRTKLASVGFGLLAKAAINLADELQDLSNSSGIATGNLVELKRALAETGGQADQLAAGVNTFIRSIDDAAQGTLKSQNAFKELGVTLQDLQTLSERDLMLKALEGFDQLTDKSRQAGLMMDLFGKSFRTVDPTALAQRLKETAGAGDRYSDAIAKGAELSDTLEKATTNLKIAFLQAFSPIIGSLNAFNSTVEKTGQTTAALTNALKALGVVIAVTFSATVLFGFIGVLGTALRGIGALAGTAGFVGLAKSMKSALRPMGTFIPMLRGIAALMATGLGIYAASQLFDDFGSIVENAAARAVEGIGRLTGELLNLPTDAIAFAINKIFGTNIKAWGFGTGLIDIADRAQAAREQTEKLQIALKDAANARKKFAETDPRRLDKKPDREVDVSQFKKQTDAIKEITDAYAKQQVQLQFKLGLEAEIAGFDEDTKKRILAQTELTESYLDVVEQLEKKKESLSRDEKDLIPVINEQIKKAKQLYDEQRVGLDNVLSKLQVANALEKERQNAIDNVTKSLERQATLADQLRSANEKLSDVKFETAQMQRSPLERQFAQIEEDARKAALAASQAFAATFEDTGDVLNPDQAEELARGLDLIAEKYKKIAEVQIANINASRTWEQGWKSAFDAYMENATDAASIAGENFSAITRNMESAIDRFVETGKFSFKDFARSIIQDLIKIELKAQATKLFSSIFGGGNIFGSIFGGARAKGGPVAGNTPYMVGEQGPELFVPKTAGNIVPNDRLGGGGQITNNYITNNISALDSKSVAQMFAENRKMLLGTVQMAQREMP